MRKGFTLIELLVVIAILAVLATAVVLILNPAELLRQGRDSTRLSDLSSIHSSLALYLADVNPADLDDDDAPEGAGTEGRACERPALSGGTTAFCTAGDDSSYNGQTCVTEASRATNGQGWIPVSLDDIAGGSPLPQLPIDPSNTTVDNATSTDDFFYGYACNGTADSDDSATAYELNANMESSKFGAGGSADVERPDGGDNLQHYEVGTALDL
jgi:prepilin-type N-terminal cleavage/methylation domain-containing protein